MATIYPDPDYNPEASAKRFKKAMKGLGTDEAEIIRQLVKHTNEQRQEIKAEFATAYGQDMEDELKSELGGDFEEAVIALLTPPRVYDARQLKKAVKGAGTTESALIEILITRSNEELEEIKAIYLDEFESELVDDVQSDTSGYIKRLLFSQCNANRNPDSDDVDGDLAAEEAQEIYDAGEGQCGTDEAAISRIFCLRNWAQLLAMFDAYTSISDKDIAEMVKSETSGSLQDAYLAIIDFARSGPGYFAKRAYDCMKGAGTNDTGLIRCIVSRSEIDLQDVKADFESLYGKSLAGFVKNDCGGDYKRLLIRVINRDE